MKRFLALLLALCLLGGFALGECPRFSLEEYPHVDGSTSMLPLSRALMMASTGVSAQEAELRISHSKTTLSFYALVSGEADLLLVARPAQEAFDYAEDMGVDSLTQQQAVGIYTGAITNWKEVGGADAEIVAYQRNETSGSQVMMENVVMDGQPMTDAPKEYRPSEMGALVDEVASYRNSADAIGYSVYYYVTEMYLREGVKLLAIDGVAPSNETIASGEYPYTQYNYAVIRADEPENSPARQLFDFLTTPEGKALMAAQGYVPAA